MKKINPGVRRYFFTLAIGIAPSTIYLTLYFLMKTLPVGIFGVAFVFYAWLFMFYAFLSLIPFAFFDWHPMISQSGAMISYPNGVLAWVLIIVIYSLVGLLLDRLLWLWRR